MTDLIELTRGSRTNARPQTVSGLSNSNLPTGIVTLSVPSSRFEPSDYFCVYVATSWAPANDDDTPHGYSVLGKAEVAEFLTTHPPMKALLEEAVPAIDRAFGRASIKRLERFRFTDESGGECVLLTIATEKNYEEAMHALSSLEDAWWLDRVCEFGSLLCIQVECE